MDEKATRPHLGEVRTKELEKAAGILGVNRSVFLGYRDSGMVGTADNENAKSFHQAPLEEAAGRLEPILREEWRAHVATYADDGTYGHPAHLPARQAANAAPALLTKRP